LQKLFSGQSKKKNKKKQRANAISVNNVPKIVLTGTLDNIKRAEEYFNDIYLDIGSIVTIPLISLFS
jgi:hypothetical protein